MKKQTWQQLIDRSIQVKIRVQPRWFCPSLHHVEVQFGDNPQTFHFSGTQAHCENILTMLSAMPKPETQLDHDTYFEKGRHQAQTDEIAGKSTLSPYPPHSSAHRWWTRGYAYASRLFRAIAAEEQLRKLRGEQLKRKLRAEQLKRPSIHDDTTIIDS
jgi:hypothetical protein